MERLTDLKLIVTDLDGTLLNEQKQIDEQVISLLPQLKKQGIAFTFGSGRNMHIMQDYLAQCHVKIPYITNNGANLFQNQTCIYENSLTTSDLLFSLTLLKQQGIAFLAYSNMAIYPVGTHPGLTKFMERLQGKCEIVETSSIFDIAEHSIFKVVIIHEDETLMASTMKAINQTCKEAHCVRSEGDIYTLTHMDASKGKTLRKLLSLMQIKDSEVLVFGDNYNDVSMFEVAKYSVAMGNASKEIKAQATYITTSNEEHGVAKFLLHHVL